MDKYYDYAEEKYVEGDPSLALTAQMLGLQMLKKKLHDNAVKREQENARLAEEDKTPFHKIYEFNGIQYVKKLLTDSFKKNSTWNDRLRNYNELLVDYLNRKRYCLKFYQKPEFYCLSLKQYKSIAKELKLNKEESK